MRQILRIIVPLLLLILFTQTAVSQNAESDTLAEYVIHISVDGLRGDYLEERLANDDAGLYPNFARLKAESASTFNARTDYTFTNTMPNHTSMLSGRPVTQPSTYPAQSHHGYTFNYDPKPDWTLHNRGNKTVDYVSSVFDVAHDNGLRTALFTGKSKFILFEQSYNAENGAPDTEGEDYGRNKIDQFVIEEDTQLLVNQFITEMEEDPYNYAFFHFRDPDRAGHDFGWGGPEWDEAVQRVDGYLGQIFELVENDSELDGRTTIILSADHGGDFTFHTISIFKANYTIPFFLWSPQNIPANSDIYDLYSKSFTDPKDKRIKYDGKPQPIRNGSSGNLALHFLGLFPVPGSMIDSPFYITHCEIEAGETYSFGETNAEIEVVKAGSQGCVGVAFVDTADIDYWRVLPYGEGYELNITLPYAKQTITSPVICPLLTSKETICEVSRTSDTAVSRDGIKQVSAWTVQQKPRPLNIPLMIGVSFAIFATTFIFIYFRNSRR